jgi:hypothetical protein
MRRSIVLNLSPSVSVPCFCPQTGYRINAFLIEVNVKAAEYSTPVAYTINVLRP